jgi:pyridoxal phosphate enzyme (YggS family)
VSVNTSIAANLSSVRHRIATAAERCGRDPAGVCLVAVSKTCPATAVIAACEAGQVEFGENRVQEATEKVPAVAAAGALARWQLIGHLQTNKARSAVDLFAIIQSVDSLHLARALSSRAPAGYPVLIEVNIAGEESKGGFAALEAEAAVTAIRSLPNLDVRGLMTLAPFAPDPEDVRPVFRRLAGLARQLALPELSMGMSNDFEVAIQEGATIVRVGTAIFGRR